MGSRSIVAAVIVAAFAGTAIAGSIQIGIANPRGRNGNGGEFIAYNYQNLSWQGKALVAGFATDAAFNSFAGNNLAGNRPANQGSGLTGAFGTFCIELGEHLTTDGHVYQAQLNDRAMLGGNGPNGDVLEYKTKWLYWNYRNNDTTDMGMDFLSNTSVNTGYGSPFTPNMALKTQALQQVIWHYEEGNPAPSASPSSQLDRLARMLFNRAEAAFTAYQNGNGEVGVSRVVAINVGTGAGQNPWHQQDQLGIVVPLPTAGGMSVAGLLTVLAVRRRVRL